MHSEDSSSRAEDQFAIDARDFIIEFISGTGIKLLRAKPETEPALSRQLDIPRRLELLRRGADRKPQPHPTPLPLEDDPGSNQPDTHFLQDVAPVGDTSRGETVYLVISALVEPSRWQGGWFIGIVPPNETETWQAHLASAREAIVVQLQHQTGAQS
jgi:hypothetical protein